MTNDGVTSSPEAALSQAYHAPRRPALSAFRRAVSSVSTRYSTIRRAMSGLTAAKNGSWKMSVSQKTWPL